VWMNSDDPEDESPYCSLCKKQIGLGTDALALRAGIIHVAGRGFRFDPQLFVDRCEVKWFHFSCLSTMFDFLDTETDSITDCAFCPEDLLGESLCYEMELGLFEPVDGDTWWRERRDDDDLPARIYSCAECVELTFKENEEDIACELFGTSWSQAG